MMPYKDKEDYNRYLRDYMRKRRGVKPPSYVKPILLNPEATRPFRPDPKPVKTHARPKISELRELIQSKSSPLEKPFLGTGGIVPSTIQEEMNSRLPLYNPAIHKPGDRVRVLRGNRTVEVVIPELDVGGSAIPDY